MAIQPGYIDEELFLAYERVRKDKSIKVHVSTCKGTVIFQGLENDNNKVLVEVKQ